MLSNKRANISCNSDYQLHLLDLPTELFVKILRLCDIDGRLINKQCRQICRDFKILKKTFIFSSVERLKWAVLNGYRFNKDTFNYAVENCNLDNMTWLKENGCHWDKLTFAYAAANGNLDNMKWLKENGCSWSVETFEKAAENGNLDNMKWLKENGCPWNEYSFRYAAQHKNPEVLKWVKTNLKN